MVTVAAVRAKLRKLGDARHARTLQWFFKTGAGGYGEGDRFLGIRLPRLRACVHECGDVPLEVLLALLASPIHEERMFALLGMVRAAGAGDENEKRRIYRAYLGHARHINNWDLVDASAPGIVGEWLVPRSRGPLFRLARSRSVWERRIAIIATAAFIRRGETRDTLRLAAMLLHDDHDLIHKAVGYAERNREARQPDGPAALPRPQRRPDAAHHVALCDRALHGTAAPPLHENERRQISIPSTARASRVRLIIDHAAVDIVELPAAEHQLA